MARLFSATRALAIALALVFSTLGVVALFVDSTLLRREFIILTWILAIASILVDAYLESRASGESSARQVEGEKRMLLGFSALGIFVTAGLLVAAVRARAFENAAALRHFVLEGDGLREAAIVLFSATAVCWLGLRRIARKRRVRQ